jgi:hypothetical protein
MELESYASNYADKTFITVAPKTKNLVVSCVTFCLAIKEEFSINATSMQQIKSFEWTQNKELS